MSDALTFEQLRGLTPLDALSEQQWRELREQLVPQPLLAGQLLFRRGDQARRTYFLLAGTLLLRSADGQEHRLTAGTPAACHPLSPGLPRQHEAVAVDDASVLVIDSTALDDLLTWRQTSSNLLLDLPREDGDEGWLEALLQNPLFAKVPAVNVRAMLERLEPCELSAGDVVIREGERGDSCYFLRRGRAEVMRGAASERQVLAELEVGACFGEEALLSGGVRNATVTLLEGGCVLRLAREDFLALLKAPVVAEVGLGEAARLLSAGAQWLDVRLQDEYERGHALEALNMPLDLLRLKARLLDPQRTYLCYCDSGQRSTSAAFLLSQGGFNAYVLRDGVDALPAVQRDALLCDSGAGYVLRSGGRIERSR